MEIEKKLLINRFPGDPETYEKKEIEQGYLCTSPTLRIRKSNDDYILTYKKKSDKPPKDGTICNTEIEAELDEAAYLHLKEKLDMPPLSKTRYIIPLGSCGDVCPGVTEEDAAHPIKAELDVFHGQLEGLVYTEVEFPSVDAAERFVKPDWIGEDVSADRRLRNSHLSGLADTSTLADLIAKSPRFPQAGEHE